VGAIRSQVDTLSTVTEGYLRFARLPKPNLQVVSLGPVIADLADFVREELRARKVQLVVDAEPGLPTVRVDASQIRQALLNLIRNAAEAMPEGGTLTVRAGTVTGTRDSGLGVNQDSGSRFVEIAVTDAGVGIAPEDLGRVFEPFFTTKEGGTGLGLAISREIAVEHGGTLACESGPGNGATFRLTLPAAEVGSGR
jgi:signal transduction histidine kinase